MSESVIKSLQILKGLHYSFPSGDVTSIFDASMQYQAEGIPLVVLAGSQYGTGSSRDWAAKGTLLLGVKAVIATSFGENSSK